MQRAHRRVAATRCPRGQVPRRPGSRAERRWRSAEANPAARREARVLAAHPLLLGEPFVPAKRVFSPSGAAVTAKSHGAAVASRAPTRAEGRGAPGDTPKTRPGCGARPRGSRGRREGRTAAPSPRGAGDARLWTFRCRGLGANLVCFRPVRGSWPSVRPQRPAGDRGDAGEGARGRSGRRARSPNPGAGQLPRALANAHFEVY